jgi:hypothetical protein
MKIPDFRLPEAPSRRGQIMVALRSAFPGYTFSVITGNDGSRYEAVSKTFGDPYCLISADAREIWQELARTVRVADGVTVRPPSPPAGGR